MCIQGKVHIFTNPNIAVCSFAEMESFGTKTSPNLLHYGQVSSYATFMALAELPQYYWILKNVSLLDNTFQYTGSSPHQHQWANKHATCQLCQDQVALVIGCIGACRKDTRYWYQCKRGIIQLASNNYCSVTGIKVKVLVSVLQCWDLFALFDILQPLI